MHIPKHFEQTEQKYLLDIIRQYPFATLITSSQAGIEAHHLPFVLTQRQGTYQLQGHVAKVNPLWKNVNEQSEVLLVFHGPNCYISPNHYPTKQQTGKAVPTWNYVAVHVQGVIVCHFDDQFKLDMLNNLTNQHEQEQDTPWAISDAPDAYIQRMLPAIVGLEIQISAITGQWKVSQNQSEINKQGVVTGLCNVQSSAALKIAALVQEHVIENATV